MVLLQTCSGAETLHTFLTTTDHLVFNKMLFLLRKPAFLLSQYLISSVWTYSIESDIYVALIFLCVQVFNFATLKSSQSELFSMIEQLESTRQEKNKILQVHMKQRFYTTFTCKL